ncbi:hypothetical protein CsSME_00005070 [Camellia sinensis var. sinensis]
MRSSSSSSLSSDKLHQYCIKKDKWFDLGSKLSPFFLLCSLGLTLIFGFFILHSPNPFKVPNQQTVFVKHHQNDDEKCDLFKGHWVPDMNGSLYTNWSCPTIPDSKNCFKNGREDADFVNWRWKPEQCDLPRFDPKTFLRIVQGKTMAFIGDSVARNQMESLLCLLSKEEIPREVYKDSEDRFRTWHFPFHDFTLMILWSKFLIKGEERVINGSNTGIFDLQLDRIDDKWAQKLPNIDYAIISDAHWFFRKLYLYEGNNLIGCVYCNEANVTDHGLGFALRMSFRAALNHINQCGECRSKMVTLLRTFSPAHFENGAWDTGGRCNRTSPLAGDGVKLGGVDLELRRIQLEEVERAKKRGERRGKKFGALDVTGAMMVRPDGHPGSHWGNKWMKGYDDCVHWCLPGPIDAWNDFLMAVLKKEAGLLV